MRRDNSNLTENIRIGTRKQFISFKSKLKVDMNKNTKVSEPNDVIEVDFDTVFPDEDKDFDPEPVRIPAPTMRPRAAATGKSIRAPRPIDERAGVH
jgi:hypothetical protein